MVISFFIFILSIYKKRPYQHKYHITNKNPATQPEHNMPFRISIRSISSKFYTLVIITVTELSMNFFIVMFGRLFITVICEFCITFQVGPRWPSDNRCSSESYGHSGCGVKSQQCHECFLSGTNGEVRNMKIHEADRIKLN